MLCEANKDYDFGSFRNDDMNKFIVYYNDLISDEQTRDKTLGKITVEL